jgi:shikimate kinase
VLATGGGAIMREDNRQHLQTRGTVVYLHTTVAEQLNRTRRDRDRPLLQTPDRQQRLTSLMAVREPLYRALADLTLCTDGRHPRNVVDQLLRALKSTAPQQ